MSEETRIVLVKPGDALIFGNVGRFDIEDLGPHLTSLKEALGLGHIVIFDADIDMAAVSRELTPQRPPLDDRLWLMGDEDCNVGLCCSDCDRGGAPIAYYAPHGGSPYDESTDVVNVTTIDALLDTGDRHLVDRHPA